MKYIVVILIFFAAGCASNDKKAATEKPVAKTNTDGEILFKANCASCHKPDKDFIGPALKGSLERWRGDKKAMYDFIRNPSKSIEENEYARKLVEKWQVGMTAFVVLPDTAIDAIMNYCENYKVPSPAASK